MHWKQNICEQFSKLQGIFAFERQIGQILSLSINFFKYELFKLSIRRKNKLKYKLLLIKGFAFKCENFIKLISRSLIGLFLFIDYENIENKFFELIIYNI